MTPFWMECERELMSGDIQVMSAQERDRLVVIGRVAGRAVNAPVIGDQGAGAKGCQRGYGK